MFTWLQSHGLESLHAVFEAEDIDLDLLSELTDDDFRELGLTLGQRKRIKRALASGTATPQSNTHQRPEHPDHSERRQLTVLFCDLVNSSALSQALDPEELEECLNQYYQLCNRLAETYGGTVAKYVGDGVDIYFGYPRANEDAATSAVFAGLKLLEGIPKLPCSANQTQALAARVGIHSGTVVTGKLGSGTQHEEMGVVGDVPIIAARLQATAKAGQLMLTGDTRRLVSRRLELLPLGQANLDGVNEPVDCFTVDEQHTRFSNRIRRPQRPTGADSIIVGRDAERMLLLAAWERAQEQDGDRKSVV